MHPLAALDQRYIWHPFTQMRDWLKTEPIVLVRGRGSELVAADGRKYLDANSSIWTNLHGHNHPQINRAILRQLRRIAHTSALGLANEPAALLAEALVEVANPAFDNTSHNSSSNIRRHGACLREGNLPGPALSKVFFSDDGSTAVEVALKLAFETARRTGRARHPRFLSLQAGYHGDTIGAESLGHIDLFHRAYAPLLFKSDKVMAPYCYRCRYNRARPEREDARQYRKCNWECLGQLERKCAAKHRRTEPYAGFVFEPLMQGAAGMIAQPAGWLGQACAIARGHGALLIADEVMTGFGRTGSDHSQDSCSEADPPKAFVQSQFGTPPSTSPASGRKGREEGARSCARSIHGVIPREMISSSTLFACHRENVQPDLLALAKGLTGGYLPMAATLTTQAIFDAFLGKYEDFKTFFHGHSFTGNQLGAAAALASLKILREPASLQDRYRLESELTVQLRQLWRHPNIGDIRQVGLVAGVELVEDWQTRKPFDLRQRAGIRVCEAMARRGVLTRPVGNVIVIMPPYCTTAAQLTRMVEALGRSIAEEFQSPPKKTRRFAGS